MDEEKIAEAVARAISDRLFFKEGKIHWTWMEGIAGDVIQAHKAALAKAGLVIRPIYPTDEMLDAGYNVSHPIDEAISYALIREIDRAMMASIPNWRSEADVINDLLHKAEKR